MSSIADSDAVQDIRRILPQHQSALTLLNGRLQNPALEQVLWLDLACGKGQIISQLNENLSNKHREKLSYFGYDINVDHTRAAERIALNLQLQNYDFFHGDLFNFNTIIPNEKRFDFITCTNTAHEFQPGAFATILLDSLVRLTQSGELFIYDMESLNTPELGALPWRSSEIGKLLNLVFEVLETEFRVHPSIWSHTSCKGWTVTIQRQYIGKTDQEISERRRANALKVYIDTS
jgi:SAM-dependent methyltransferase